MKYKKNIPTFLFYDYETFGTHTALDKPAQFACIRTDLNLNIINTPTCFYCFPSDDYIPDPNAILITHITPQYTQQHGMNEYNFSRKIYNILTEYNTCIIGYNNINFDDEITRNIFYRNFFDPYEWSWKNYNSRWDALNLLRACYALRPTGIKWPINKLGLISFKLSDLTKINNIMHKNAHDAIADVYATIEMTKLVKKNQPKLFDFFFKIRQKNILFKFINLKMFKPIIYVSNLFSAIRNNISLIFPITWHHNNKNIVIAIDLFNNVKELLNLCRNIFFNDSFIKTLFNKGIIFLHLNRCPMLAPIQILRKEDYKRLNLSCDILYENIQIIKKSDFFIKNIRIIFSQEQKLYQSSNVDLQIYHSFFDFYDKKIIKCIRDTNLVNLKNMNYNFHDVRLKELFFRYRARNNFNTLSNFEKKRWLKHCFNILNPQSLQEYKNNIKILLQHYSHDIKKIILLKKSLSYIIEKYNQLLCISASLS